MYEELIKGLRYCKDDAYCSICSRYEQSRCFETLHNDAAAAIEALQAELEKKRTADCCGCKCEKVEPKRGEWIDESLDYNWYGKCSVCGEEFNVDSWYGSFHYCPNCGAKMEVQE